MSEILEVKRVDGHLSINGYRRIPDINTEGSIDIQGPTEIVAAHFHMRDDIKHRKDDGLVRPEEFPHFALRRGIHELIPTGHNTVKGLQAMIDEVERRQLDIKITPAVEYEAAEDDRPKHIIVLNPGEVPPPGMSVT